MPMDSMTRGEGLNPSAAKMDKMMSVSVPTTA